MKALTIWQPWAQLIVRGVKTIETRAWSTSYRGPLAIHAGQRVAPAAPGLPEVPDAPRGAFVGVVWLVDCAPIGGPTSFRTGIVQGDEGDWPGQAVVHHPSLGGTVVDEYLALDDPKRGHVNITDQLPLGDFRPGRWAWMLDDPIEFAEPVDARGQQGLWDCDVLLDA